MPSFAREIRTIRTLLAGSPWGAEPPVGAVLSEYDRFVGAARLRHRDRQTSLQIFYASRAIDSLLVHVVRWERTRPGGTPGRHSPEPTLGGSIRFIRDYGINGHRFSRPTRDDLLHDLTHQRNRFMHEAGSFPTNAEMTQFLAVTLAGIQEIIRWR
jgi:hypothetical protein